MSGRGDNNKNGTSGRGAGNQSMQGMKDDHEKAYHGKQTGGQRSEPEEKTKSQSSHRNSSLDDLKR